ncbi:MAG: S8 family serine peptidase, partial [Proteobacteria bacterium]|nr:S8 family serine peptidase [Pseudomonadota bacterium]
DGRVYAPGRDILTLLPGDRYDFASGSSLATAQVSGIVALMLSRHPALTAEAAREFLQRTGERVASAGAQAAARNDAQLDNRTITRPAAGGAQRAIVDACAALAAAAGHGRCPPPDAPPERVAGAH